MNVENKRDDRKKKIREIAGGILCIAVLLFIVMQIMLPETGIGGMVNEGSMAVLFFGVGAVVIDINNIRNKLSGLFAPYPNGNNMFHYQFSADSDSGMTKLKVTFPKGHFTVSNVQWHLCNKHIFDDKNTITKAVCDSRTERSAFLSGTTVFSGSIHAESNGVLASAIPRQNGLELYIDGRRTDIIRVNKAFAGAHIEKGTHKIEFRFSPPGKQIGCIISLISLLCYLSYLIFTFGVFTSRKTQNITTAHHKNAL